MKIKLTTGSAAAGRLFYFQEIEEALNEKRSVSGASI
jgi:hypothetical protein